MKVLLSFVLSLAAACGATVTSPYVEVFFGGSGTIPRPTLAGEVSSTVASETHISGFGEFPAYEMSATAAFGILKVSAEQSGVVNPGETRAMNSFARFVDTLVISAPESSSGEVLLQPTIHLTGFVDWTAEGILDPTQKASVWPVGIGIAQYVRREGETTFTRYSEPDVFPDEGAFDQEITFQRVPVPLDQPFNYAILVAVVARVRDLNGLQISHSLGDFSNTLTVSGLNMFDSLGQELAYSVQAASGATYDVNGIASPVPEPGTFAAAVAALTGLGIRRRLQKN